MRYAILHLTALVLALAPLRLRAQQTPGAGAHALDRAALDTTCAACGDFYAFANGGWLKSASIPAAYAAYGTLYELADRNEAIVHQILDDATAAVRAGTAKVGSDSWKVGTFYDACMDSTRVERLGVAPLEPLLRRIEDIHDARDVARAFGWLEHEAGLAPFGIDAAQDFKNTSQIIAMATQGGLGLPERDFYFRTDEKSRALRDAYVGHVARMLQLMGESADRATADAGTILALETSIARGSMGAVAMRDPKSIYHKMSLAEFERIAPHLHIAEFLAAIGAPTLDSLNVAQPDFFHVLDSLVAAVPAADWKAYLRWRAVRSSAPALPARFVAEDFRWQQQLLGQKELRPRWKRCADQTKGVLGDAIGQEYVHRTFGPAARARALLMVDDLRAVLREDIGQLAWMGDSTRQQALTKLDAFTRKIGYPDRWRDYSALRVVPGHYLENLRLASQWGRARNWAKLGKPVDRSEWAMLPTAVNAYYNPLMNEIVFPAGILQPPFFDASADDAANYGAVGAVIGHEMTHGFDDQGRHFDAAGNLRDWWTAEDAAKFAAQAQLVASQFDAYTVVDSATHVNGKLTLGENIADLGGLKIAYLALEKALARERAAGHPAGRVDGFTPEQRFFLAWAQVWREQTRDEAQRTLVRTNPHAPARWRVNGPLSNMPEFAAAWGCKRGDAMVRPDSLRAHIW